MKPPPMPPPFDILPGKHRDATRRLLTDTARELVDYLLFIITCYSSLPAIHHYLVFIDEAPIDGNIQGSSGFTEWFSAQGPRDRQGRSLRQLDLRRRLMRSPCSYMIYTKAFDGLPDEARQAIYQRMWQVLSGQEKGERYARLSLAYRQAIIEILRDTSPGLPDYFQVAPPA